MNDIRAEHGQENIKLLPAISIRQPWAWMIINGGKDVENRTWKTKFRGRVLIHAAKGLTMDEWRDAWNFAKNAISREDIQLIRALSGSLGPHTVQRGGIVGIAEIVDCVTVSDSRWFVGPYGFVLRKVEPIPFIPCRGALGFFKPDFLSEKGAL